ncbi:pyridoxal-phosphate dependent enzyme [Sediminimonas sp.]|uniref:pyridoxal-phosphate dependent enzyme n=1 Tax=Sediminimonas sp. TaxID=2823379 RepID=UPI0025F069BD|nr:pyridoxal-phosphate dependent enzyme [Sediminimonas sp.]
MEWMENPWRGRGLSLPDVPAPSIDAAAPEALLARCPKHRETPLLPVPELARRSGIGELRIKDERGRMGLGSFKALGAAYVIAHAAQAGPLAGRTYVTASAGNHGLSVAAGARVFGARAVIYLARSVPESFADRLRAEGAEVVRAGDDYEASMEAAAQAAHQHGWTLLSDSSWPGYIELPHRLMEGYLAMAAEIARQATAPPDVVLLQAGVGGMAGAVAAYLRHVWGDVPRILVVEPAAAPALWGSIKAGAPVAAQGPQSAMGRLDCKVPSLIALKGLARDADAFALISEREAEAALAPLAAQGLASTPSGAAGVAAALAGVPGVGKDAQVLCILSEAAS